MCVERGEYVGMEALSHWRKGARVFKSLSADRYKTVKVGFSF